MTSKATHAKKSAKQSSNTISNLDKVTYRERVLECGLKLDRSFNSVLYVTCSFDLIREDDGEIILIVDYEPYGSGYHIYEGIYPDCFTRIPERGECLESGSEILESAFLSHYFWIRQSLESINIQYEPTFLVR